MPPEVVQAAKECNLVLFIGAGVSRLMGCPSWPELADAALRHLAKKEFISFADVQQLASLDPKKRLTIATQIAEAAGERLEIEKLLQPQKRRDCKVYDYINGIGCACVTTNFDPFLDGNPTKARLTMGDGSVDVDAGTRLTKVICRPAQLSANLLRQRGVAVHLHGSETDPGSMIVSHTQYLEHYADDHVQDFLTDMFARHTVVFIGYGLEEAEILEQIFRKGVQGAISTRRCFMLQGFYSHQKQMFKHLYDYWNNTFGVELLPYNLDVMEYEQLEIILKDWAGRLEIGNPLLADDLNYVLGAADE